MSTAEEIRASLAPIVDRLIQKNPGLARDFQAKFPTFDSATEWVSHELGQLSKQITGIAEGSKSTLVSPGGEEIDAYVEQVIVPALAASLKEIDTKSLTEDDIFEALNNALVELSQAQGAK